MTKQRSRSLEKLNSLEHTARPFDQTSYKLHLTANLYWQVYMYTPTLSFLQFHHMLFVCLCICVCVFVYVYLSLCICVCVFVYLSLCMAGLHQPCPFFNFITCCFFVCVFLYLCICVFVYLSLCICVFEFVYGRSTPTLSFLQMHHVVCFQSCCKAAFVD